MVKEIKCKNVIEDTLLHKKVQHKCLVKSVDIWKECENYGLSLQHGIDYPATSMKYGLSFWKYYYPANLYFKEDIPLAFKLWTVPVK